MSLGQALGIVGAVVGNFFLPGIGGAIGYLAGSLIGNLLDPPKIEGPRLTDLKLQVSEYGKPIPIIYGTMRIAGNVIWQTDLQEHKQKSSSKGGPTTINYTYSASFAVMLSACFLDGVDEIFADGRKVWPGTDGFDFTFYQGTEDQLPDPTMEAEIGVGLVPAHRGYAYVVFDDLNLTDYGNRIPQLEFIVSTEARDDGISLINVNYQDAVLDDPNGFGGADSQWRYILDWPLNGQPITAALSDERTYLTDIFNGSYHDASTLEANGNADSFGSGKYWPNLNGLAQRTGVAEYRFPSGVGQMYLWARNFNVTVGHASLYYIVDADGLTNFIHDAGVPGAVYPVGCAITQDEDQLFIFTSTVNGTTAPDHWYKIVDGLVTASGTCTAGLSDLIATGKRPVYGIGNAISVENNGRYFWAWNTAGQELRIYYMDGAGNIDDWGNGTLPIPFTTNGSAPVGVETGSVHTLEDEGYCGVVLGTGIALAYRLGPRPPIALSTIVSDLSSRSPLDGAEYDTTALTDLVRGYQVAVQTEIKNAIQPLRQAYFFDAVERDGVVVFVKRGGASAVTIPEDDLSGRGEGESLPALLRSVRKQEAELPKRVYVEYINAEADYQKGTQYDERQITDSQSETTLTLPISLSDANAKNIAGVHVWGAYQEREAFTWWTSRKYEKYEPTDVMTVQSIDIRVESRTERPNGVIEWSGVMSRSGLYDLPTDVSGVPAGDPGQILPTQRVNTQLVLLDIPVISQDDSPFGFYAAMGPASDGPWPGAGLYKSLDGGSTYSLVASTNTPDTIGSTTGSPGALGNYTGSLTAMDTTSSVDVLLSNPETTLSSVTQTALDNGANLCAIKSGTTWEMLQFRDATLIGTNTYTLTNFYRGKLGSEGSIAGHAGGDTFVLMPCINVDAPENELNVALKYKAVTFGKSLSSATAVTFTNTGEGANEFYDVELRNLDTFVGDIGSPDSPKKGLVPAPDVGDCAAGKFLSACGVWSVPAGTGGGSPSSGGGGSGGGAPVDAQYLVRQLDGTLTNEAVLTAGAGLTSADGGGSPPTSFTMSVTGVPTTKGDLWGYSTTNVRIPAGSDGWILAYNSSNANGWEYYNLAGNLAATWGRTYITVTNETLLTNERAAAGTAGNISLTDNGANSSIVWDLVNTAVTPGTYGDATHVARFTVDANGRLTAASNVALTSAGGYSNSQLFTTPGVSSFVVPAGVSALRATFSAAGGGGSARAGAANSGSGGGAGEYAIDFPVGGLTPGSTIYVLVGAAGTGATATGGTAAGVDGGVSAVNCDNLGGGGYTVRGGRGGAANGTGGQGGGTRGATGGSAAAPGVAGAVGTAESPKHFGGSSGGGGGTTTTANGGAGGAAGGFNAGAAGGATAASQAGGGSGATSLWGLGGAGGAGGAAGVTATAANYGAGGGGAGGKATTSPAAGDGAPGFVLLEWTA